jgi:hypothetical protein
MTRGDQVLERAAEKLDGMAQHAAREDGVKAKLAEPLAEDAALLRGMRPSQIAARVRGRPGGEPGAKHPLPPPDPDPPGLRPERQPKRRGGPSPILVAIGAFAVGIVIAKVIDWRGHAHPR